MNDFSKRLVELDELLNFLSYEELLKIPQELLKMIKENKDENYTWKYNKSLSLIEQSLNKDTLSMLSYITITYLLSDDEKDLAMKFLEINELKRIKRLQS